MGRFDEIKNKINANINENGEQRITGQILNEVLIDEVNTIDEAITELEESIGQGGSGGGGGSTGEAELRPLYVPNLNAGSTLTDSQMAYNEETCQKMLNGAAIAVVTDGTTASYSENITDLSMFGMLGYIVSFRGLGGFYISGGEVALTLPDVSTSVTITTDVESYDTLSLIMALATSNMGMLPTFYFLLEDATNNMFIIDDITTIGAGFILTTRFEHGTNTYQLICALDAEGGNVLELRMIPFKLTLGESGSGGNQANAHWVASSEFVKGVIPKLVYYGSNVEYVPVAIENYTAAGGKRTKFTIYRNGAFETWEMNSAGVTQLIQ